MRGNMSEDIHRITKIGDGYICTREIVFYSNGNCVNFTIIFFKINEKTNKEYEYKHAT
jgi:hypothetical protein